MKPIRPLHAFVAVLASCSLTAHAGTYTQDFTAPDGTTDMLDGSTIGTDNPAAGTVVSNELQLTLASIPAGHRSSFRTPAVADSSTGWIMTVDYTLADAAGGNPPADGFSINYGAIPARTGPGANADQDGQAEEGWGGGIEAISFEVDTWMNVDAEQGVNIAVNQVDIPNGFINGSPINNDGTATGTITIGWIPGYTSYTSTGLVTNAAFKSLPHGFVGNDAYVWGISGRTGGANEDLFIDNISITTGTVDTDADGLTDVYEVATGLDPNEDGTVGETVLGAKDGPDGALGDPDGDTVTNMDEQTAGTNPCNADTDGDGLDDSVEDNGGAYVNASMTGTDPLNPDTDADGLLDSYENNSAVYNSVTDTGTDPHNPDTDGDGLLDPVETNTGVNNGPSDTGTSPFVADTDGDTIPDGYEIDNFLDPFTDDTLLDQDGDTLSNIFEFNNGLLAGNPDSDGDGLNDNVETNNGVGSYVDPTNTGTDPLVVDTDGDGLSDGQEVTLQGLGVLRDPTTSDYPAAGTVYSQDFNGFPDGTTVLGDRSLMVGTAQVINEKLQLTSNTNSNVASFHVDTMVDTNLGFAFVADYTIVDNTGNPPADGWSFSAGALPYGSNSAQAEEGFPGVSPCLSFEMDTWMNGDAEVGPAIGFDRPANIAAVGNSLDASSVAFTNGDILADDGSVSGKITIVVDASGNAKFNTTGALTNADFDVATGYTPENTHTFAFAARTGGANEEVTIDNLFIATDPDSDGDGLLTIWEIQNGLDPNSAVGDDGALGDPDLDGSTNTQEQANGSDPQDEDSDDDTLLDGVETNDGIYAGPGATGTSPINADTDGDTFGDEIENNSGTYNGPGDPGTDPNNADSDGDGYNDNLENNSGTFNSSTDPGTDPNNADTDGDGLSDSAEGKLFPARDPNLSDPPAPSNMYVQNFDGLPDGCLELGDGSAFAGNAVVMGEALQLTTNTNGNNAAFHIPALLDSSTGFTIKYDYRIFDNTGNPPADGFALSYGNLPFGGLSATAEEGFPGVTPCLSFEMDTWDGGSDWGPAIGVDDVDAAFTFGPILGDEEDISGEICIQVAADGTASFTSTGATTNATFTGVATGFVLNDAFTFAFTGRTGGANEEVLIDNISIITGPIVGPRMVDATLNAALTEGTLFFEGLTVGQVYHLVGSVDGENYAPLPGSEFTPGTPEFVFGPLPVDVATTPFLLVKAEAGAIPVGP